MDKKAFELFISCIA